MEYDTYANIYEVYIGDIGLTIKYQKGIAENIETQK